MEAEVDVETLEEMELTPPEVPRSLARELSRVDASFNTSQIGGSPDRSLLRKLQRHSQRTYFEYCGLFARAELANALRPPSSHDAGGRPGSRDALRTVLMVAEKPSISEALSRALHSPRPSRGDSRGGADGLPRRVRGVSKAIPIYEFVAPHVCADGVERRCVLRVTSTVGHIFGLSFAADASSGEDGGRRRSAEEHFWTEVVKSAEGTSDKLRVIDHLRAASAGCDELHLWLDCDREGENIAHEVLSVTRGVFRDVPAQVRRARFSSLQADELREAARQAHRHLPDAAASLAVDTRQELDLRAGVAFTRLLTQRCAKLARDNLGAASRCSGAVVGRAVMRRRCWTPRAEVGTDTEQESRGLARGGGDESWNAACMNDGRVWYTRSAAR